MTMTNFSSAQPDRWRRSFIAAHRVALAHPIPFRSCAVAWSWRTTPGAASTRHARTRHPQQPRDLPWAGRSRPNAATLFSSHRARALRWSAEPWGVLSAGAALRPRRTVGTGSGRAACSAPHAGGPVVRRKPLPAPGASAETAVSARVASRHLLGAWAVPTLAHRMSRP